MEGGLSGKGKETRDMGSEIEGCREEKKEDKRQRIQRGEVTGSKMEEMEEDGEGTAGGEGRGRGPT